MREVEVVVERGGGPDLSNLDAPMRAIDSDPLGFLALLEIEGEVFEQPALVAFDGEVVVRLPVLDQVTGKRALRQERIRADVFALDIDGVQKRDGHLDLIGLFDRFVARYR